jgi:hypothetical protein
MSLVGVSAYNLLYTWLAITNIVASQIFHLDWSIPEQTNGTSQLICGIRNAIVYISKTKQNPIYNRKRPKTPGKLTKRKGSMFYNNFTSTSH